MKPPGPFTDIGVEKAGHVALVEIRRPPNNFFDVALIGEIAAAFEALDADAECRALVLAAQGKVFCAGADFGDGARSSRRRAAADGPPPGAAHLYIEGNRLFRTKKPIVAAVHGAAVGGGLGLAMVADFRVTCREARFSANFTRLGFHPGFGLTVTLPAVDRSDQGGADVLHQPPRARATRRTRWACRHAGAAGSGPQRGAFARRRNRREFAARSDRNARHAARRSCRPRARSDRTRTRRANAGCARPTISRKASRRWRNAACRFSPSATAAPEPAIANQHERGSTYDSQD